MRKAEIKRDTNETKISLTLNLDGSGKAEIRSGFRRKGDILPRR